jgi:hypothetical protein
MTLSQQFVCPVETCQHTCKTKTGWTKHLHSVHANLDFSNLQSSNYVLNLGPPRFLPTLDNPAPGLASLPGSDFEMEDVATQNDFPDFNLRSSPFYGSEVGDNREYHSVIDGMLLFNVNCHTVIIDDLR